MTILGQQPSGVGTNSVTPQECDHVPSECALAQRHDIASKRIEDCPVAAHFNHCNTLFGGYDSHGD